MDQDPSDTTRHQLEQQILGVMMNDPDQIEPLSQIHPPEHHHDPRHTTIHRAIRSQHQTGHPTDPTAIAHHLHQTGGLAKAGGLSYLHDCWAAPATTANGTWYARQAASYATRDQLRTLGIRITQTAEQITDPDRLHTQLTDLHTQLGQLRDNTNHTTRIVATNLAGIQLQPVDWLWHHRIPLGELTLIGGREGVGKSTFLAWLAAAITRGTLPGHHHGTPRGLLYAAAEDSYSRTIAPRMWAAGADLQHTHRIHVETSTTSRRITLPTDLHLLPEVIKQTDAAAILLDPILSAVDDNTNPNRAQEVRAVLEPLQHVADQTGVAIIGLAHFNKSKEVDASTMFAGSRAWLEVARAALIIAQDKDAEQYTCVVSQTKNNLGRLDLPNLTYTIQDTTITLDDSRDLRIGRLDWTGESEEHAERILQRKPTPAPDRGNRGDRTNQIVDWVEDQPGAVSLREIQEQFRDVDPRNVKVILSRSVARGDLYRPTSGMYAARPVPEPAPLVEQPALVSCRVCHAPLDDVAGTGVHPGCVDESAR